MHGVNRRGWTSGASMEISPYLSTTAAAARLLKDSWVVGFVRIGIKNNLHAPEWNQFEVIARAFEQVVLMGSHANSETISEGHISNAFSALHLLRSYNSLLTPSSEVCRSYDAYNRASCHHPTRGGDSVDSLGRAMLTGPLSPLAPSSSPFTLAGLLQPPLLAAAVPPLGPPVGISHPFANNGAAAAVSRNIIENAVMSSMHHSRRPRSEKKPIPDEQKDDKYYERRKRNNQAAKKSRDARKIREDHIALKATVLEHENALLRAQVLALREECQSLRQLLIKQRMPPLMQSLDQLSTGPNNEASSSLVTLTSSANAIVTSCRV